MDAVKSNAGPAAIKVDCVKTCQLAAEDAGGCDRTRGDLWLPDVAGVAMPVGGRGAGKGERLSEELSPERPTSGVVVERFY